jgi:hypothetical protein
MRYLLLWAFVKPLGMDDAEDYINKYERTGRHALNKTAQEPQQFHIAKRE